MTASSTHAELKTFLEEAAAAWRTDAVTVRTMGGRIKFDPDDADLVADLMLEAAQAIGELMSERDSPVGKGGAA